MDALGVPPEKAVRIMAAVEGWDEICVITQGNQVYCYDSAQNNWQTRTPAQAKAPYSLTGSCGFEVANLPDKLLDRFNNYNCFEFAYQQTSYALLQDGSVWKWTHSTSFGNLVFVYWGSRIFGPIIGLTFAMWLLRHWRKRTQTT